MSRSEDKQVISQGDSLVPVRRAVAMMVPGGDMMGADGAPQGPSNLDAYVHALRRTWLWCLLAGGVLAAVVGVAVYQLAPNRYTATAEVRASTIAPRLLTSTGVMNQQEKYETFISNMQQALQSRMTLTTALSDPNVKDNSIVRDEPDQEEWLASKLRIANPKNSEVLLVSVTVPEPQLARDLANAVVETYMKDVVAKEDETKGDNLKKLEDFREQLKGSEESMRATISQLATSLGTIDGKALSLEQEIRLSQAQQVKTELAKTKIERLRAAADVLVLEQRKAIMEAGNFIAPPDEVEMMVMQDPVGRILMDEISALDFGTKQASALTRKNDDNNAAPSFALGQGRQMVQELATRLERLREKMAMQWRTRQLQEFRTEIEEKRALVSSLEDLEKNLAADASIYDQQFKSFGSMAYKVQFQNEELERVNTLADSISREIEIAKIERDSQPRVQSTPAILPRMPNRPGKPVLAGMAGFLTFFLPGLGLILLDVRSQRVNSVHEVTDRLGLPVFGSVPMLPARVSRGVDSTSKRGRRWQAVLSEAVSGIRANLLRISDVRCVMVTSAIGGEGKTTVATQLAMSLARIGKRTALVDFDLPRPAINTVFDVPLEPGICDVLRCDYSLADVGHEVSLPNLTIITSGIADAASARYMNSGRIAEVLDELREQFDYVIVDGSPLIPVADARVVSRYVDGAICCVLRDVSRLKLIRQAVDLLATFNVRLLGTGVTGQQDTYYYAYEGDRESVQS